MTTDLLSLIGNTPLLELPHLAPHKGVSIFAKLEGQNPSGSVKDRIVLAMVEAAERRGELKPGNTIVEASSGNTAIALAMVGKQKGYGVHVVIPRRVAPSIADILRLFGARVTWCGSEGGMKSAIDLAIELAKDHGHYYLHQFTDDVNRQAHYYGTGAEIVEALPQVDAFVAGIGTGGTIMGVGRRLREANSAVKVIGVEPRMGDQLQGLRNISEAYPPPLLDVNELDGRYLVDSVSAIKTARTVVAKEGLFAGVSSGATLFAALRLAKKMKKGNIVVMFSDGGWKYLPSRPWDASAKSAQELDEVHWW
jgi:cysteine synthase